MQTLASFKWPVTNCRMPVNQADRSNQNMKKRGYLSTIAETPATSPRFIFITCVCVVPHCPFSTTSCRRSRHSPAQGLQARAPSATPGTCSHAAKTRRVGAGTKARAPGRRDPAAREQEIEMQGGGRRSAGKEAGRVTSKQERYLCWWLAQSSLCHW